MGPKLWVFLFDISNKKTSLFFTEEILRPELLITSNPGWVTNYQIIADDQTCLLPTFHRVLTWKSNLDTKGIKVNVISTEGSELIEVYELAYKISRGHPLAQSPIPTTNISTYLWRQLEHYDLMRRKHQFNDWSDFHPCDQIARMSYDLAN